MTWSAGLRLGAFATVLSLVLADIAGASPSTEPLDNRAMVVTSDTSAYCRSLSDMIAARRPLPLEVKELKSQGDGMCLHGKIRGGITRLRRALVVLKHDALTQQATPH